MLKTLRKQAGRALRRLGLLPGGVPDGLGEDAQLDEFLIESRAVVFFPDTPENLYQIRQWYDALQALDAAMGVTIVTQDSRTARAIRGEVELPVLIVGLNRTYSALIRRSKVQLALYVGQSNNNAVGQRSAEIAHVFLSHGDSDKAVAASNLVKGFDFAFVAGQAAVDRYAASVKFFDVDQRLRVIGRPQLPERGERTDATTVLYAPTWEGSQDINAYSSVASHGLEIVKSLGSDPDLSIVYRPHPRTGVSNASFGVADAAIREFVGSLGDRGRVDTSADAAPALRGADVMISDISAIAVDWLSQSRPLLITTPSNPDAQPTGPSKLAQACPRISATAAPDTARLVRAAIADESHASTIGDLADYYLGGLSGAASTARFVETCVEIGRLRDDQWATSKGADDE
ncbi:CDP-glycerol glycerophosphotransferase family protein [Demequina aurantiaca]|uniref:CDP-glycerol glycerophosphotransferase family protein n=1 Tax=Demequina aurantiaca TaxID=676200 RepID=UPI003D3598F8